MSTQINVIRESGVKGTQLQISQFSGPAPLGLMLQLSQAFGLAPNEPGFVQLTRQDVEELKWLNTTDPPQSGFAIHTSFHHEHRN